MKRFFAALLKPFLKIPALRRRYLVRTLDYIEQTPTSKLPEELRPVQKALKQLPTRQQRLAVLEQGFSASAKEQVEVVSQSRALRRAAAKQQRRR